MLNYFILSLFLLSLCWQLYAEDPAELLEQVDNDFEVNESNATDSFVAPQPRFVQVNINDKTYTFNFEPVNWHTAREQCTAQNLVLASIHSPQESIDIQRYLLMHGILNSNTSFWIGATQLGHIGQWSWVSTGRPSSYTNWKDREPEAHCDRHCVELLGDGKWNNLDCDNKRPIICQNLPSCNAYANTFAG